MGLSNWDTLALTLDGPCAGTITSALGITVEIYKNWLYVKDPHNAREGGRYDRTTETVMQIDTGSVCYLDVSIEAIRGPQNGVFAIVQTGNQVMIGCGVYGWGPRPEGQDAVHDPQDARAFVPPPWIGVNQESLQLLREHCYDLLGTNHPLMASPWWQNPTRFNQGDAYFAEVFGLDSQNTVTLVGEQDQPLVASIFDA